MKTARTVVAAAFALMLAACTGDGAAPTAESAPVTSTAEPTATTEATIPSPTTTNPATTPTSSPTASTAVPADDPSLRLEKVADGFTAPLLVTHRPDDDRIYVVDQPGRIWAVDGTDRSLFLDINELVTFGGERGLLGMAFHPQDPSVFYVNYTDGNGNTVVAEFASDADRADPGSQRVVLTVEQPAPNHNGGMVAFGPDDNLWIGMGDGGSANDRFGNGQRGDTLLGSMLRIRVDPRGEGYTSPDGNEFEAPEVWAVGLRNPWRFSFDGDDLWIADVGQNAVEEVDRVSAWATGLNFGWPVFEGSSCFGAQSACVEDTFVFPVAEYPHPEGCSITGGVVYRGSSIPTIAGHYFFSDYCSGILRSFAPEGEVYDWTDQTGEVHALGFGSDGAGELYIGARDGAVYRLVNG